MTQQDYDQMDANRLARENASLLETDTEDISEDVPLAQCHLINRQSLKIRLSNVTGSYPINVGGQLYGFNDLT